MSTKKSLRALVIKLHDEGKTNPEIVKTLKPLKINRMFVYRTLKRYKETSSLDDRPRSGRPRSARTPAIVKRVREMIRRNPRRRQTHLARKYNVGQSSISRLVREDLKMRSYRLRKRHLLSEASKAKRLTRCKLFLKRMRNGTMPNPIFSDEKIFTIEASYHPQNDRVIAQDLSSLDPAVSSVLRRQKPPGVMV